METAELADFARNFAVMVRTQGPDPKGLKMRKHAFHLHQSGTTSLSASGVLLDDQSHIFEHITRTNHHSGTIVITMASVIEPFLIAEHRKNPTQESLPRLIPGASIDVLVEAKEEVGKDESPDRDPFWVSSKLLAIVNIPAAADAVISLLGTHGGPFEQSSWELSWSLPPLNSDSIQQDDPDIGLKDQFYRLSSVDEPNNVTVMAKVATRIAILGISTLKFKEELKFDLLECQKKGDFLLAMGSPFGVLSPFHFYNSVATGTIANSVLSNSNRSPLLMVDIHCLPGMEGGPIFNKRGFLTGILTKPLKQKGGIAEIQLAISLDAIVAAQSNKIENTNINIISNHSPSFTNSLEMAIASIVLVMVNDGTWASGIVINSHGVILTNAHVLDPERFTKKPGLGTTSNAKHEGSLINNLQKNYKRISVRLHHMKQHRTYRATAVYVSKGPWDVALLQIDNVPDLLFPIVPEFECPCVGSTVYVIGHGLIGPRSELSPSVTSGVLGNVVMFPNSNVDDITKKNKPIMLQTTAAVHPGASGGAVVNSNGCLIGLVTSNARHGGGTIIPYLNFSIPTAVLEPIFKYSEKQDISILEAFDEQNEILSTVWSLSPPEEKRRTEAKEIKGSQFSQFIAEKNKQFLPFEDRKVPIVGKIPSKI